MKAVGVLLVCTVLAASGLVAGPKQQAQSPRSATLRSALLPGWGQRRQGRKQVALRFLAGHALAVGVTLYSYRQYNARQREYETNSNALIGGAFVAAGNGPLLFRLLNATSASRRDRDAAASILNLSAGGLLGIYIWNLVDAYLFDPGAVALSGDGNTLRAVYVWRF